MTKDKHSNEAQDEMKKVIDDSLTIVMQAAADRDLCPHCLMMYLAANSMFQAFHLSGVLGNMAGKLVVAGEVFSGARILADIAEKYPNEVKAQDFKPQPRH